MRQRRKGVNILYFAAIVAMLSFVGTNFLSPAIERGNDDGESRGEYTAEFTYLGASISLVLHAQDKQEGEAAIAAAEAALKNIHHNLDRDEEGGDIYRINNAPPEDRVTRVSEETFYLIQTAIEYCEQSGGAYDVSLGAVLDLWGFEPASANASPSPGGGAFSLMPFTLGDQTPRGVPPSPGPIAEALAGAGYTKIKLDGDNYTVETPPGLIIDLGSLAKGYAVRSAAEALRAAGIANAVINAEGDVFALGGKPLTDEDAEQAGVRPWNVGINHPRPVQGADLLAIIPVSDGAVVTTGDYEKYFEYEGERYHHVLDPSTGAPAGGTLCVTVVSDDAVLADYLSNAVFVLGPERGLELAAAYPGADVLIMAADTAVYTSPGFTGEILIEGE